MISREERGWLLRDLGPLATPRRRKTKPGSSPRGGILKFRNDSSGPHVLVRGGENTELQRIRLSNCINKLIGIGALWPPLPPGPGKQIIQP